ncbi:MAG: prefoldin subunit alpha [Nanoarchaeota archaeon]|nr:prefoldin subunit alpha [Nanoarchaeota archaeon]
MTKEEYIFQFNMLQKEAEKMQEQLQIINQQIAEFEILKLSLEKIENHKEEMLSSLGKGIFIKTKPLEKELFVNIGNGIVLKKTTKDTEKIIEKQVKQLEDIKQSLLTEIEKINMELQRVLEQAQNSK